MCPNLEYLRFEGDYSTSTDEDLEPQYLDIPPESPGFLTQVGHILLSAYLKNVLAKLFPMKLQLNIWVTRIKVSFIAILVKGT